MEIIQRCTRIIVFLLLLVSCLSTENSSPGTSADSDANTATDSGETESRVATEPGSESSGEGSLSDAGTMALERFNELLSSSPLNNALTQLYSRIAPRLTQGEISIRSFGEAIASPLDRSQVRYNAEESSIVILIHASILDNFTTSPLPVLGEIAKNLPFIETFISRGSEFQAVYENPVTVYLSQMDGVYLQTLFIEGFARELGGLGNAGFENYLLQSRTVDDFSSFSLFALGVDREITYSMLALSSQLERGEVTASFVLSEVLRLGRSIESNVREAEQLYIESGGFNNADGEVARRTYYIALTSALSYRSFGSIILANSPSLASETNYSSSIESIYANIDEYVERADTFRRDYQRNFASRL